MAEKKAGCSLFINLDGYIGIFDVHVIAIAKETFDKFIGNIGQKYYSRPEIICFRIRSKDLLIFVIRNFGKEFVSNH